MSARPRLREDGIPTRCDLTRMTPAELAITEAMRVVEEAGANESLTKAVILLGQARDLVADHAEGVSGAPAGLTTGEVYALERVDAVERAFRALIPTGATPAAQRHLAALRGLLERRAEKRARG